MTLLVAGWVAIDEIETPFAKVEDSLGGSATCAATGAPTPAVACPTKTTPAK